MMMTIPENTKIATAVPQKSLFSPDLFRVGHDPHSIGRYGTSLTSANTVVPKATIIMRTTAAFHSMRHLSRSIFNSAHRRRFPPKGR